MIGVEQMIEDTIPTPYPAGAHDTSHLAVRLRSVRKAFPLEGRSLAVLDGIDLDVEHGAWVTLVGPSGCGKTTLLRVLAGLTQADEGTVSITGAASGLGPAYLPQSDTLLPWRDVLHNAMLAAELASRPRAEARAEAMDLLMRFGLSGFERLYPGQLSGGMRQRVAIIRTFLARRDLLLLDEPLGALDPLTRSQLQDWLVEVWSALQVTVILVTHDAEEAVLLSDRVHVLTARPARICRTAAIDWPRPRSRSTAALVDARADLLRTLLETEAP
jgi:ABC-type nitrate/sulfonate/bicarbonate transport system ATPase subunit